MDNVPVAVEGKLHLVLVVQRYGFVVSARRGLGVGAVARIVGRTFSETVEMVTYNVVCVGILL